MFENKKKQQQILDETIFWDSIYEMCKYTLDKEEIAVYSLNIIEKQEKIADIYDLDLEHYINAILQKEISDYFQEIYELGEKEIKKYLTIGAIFQNKGFSIIDKEYRDMCRTMGIEYHEAKEDKYLDAMVQFYIMEEKLLQYFKN